MVASSISPPPPGAILVHCMAGISRSPSVVAAYLMRAEGLSLADALAAIVSVRPIVSPNRGFLVQLAAWNEMGCRLVDGHPVLVEVQDRQLQRLWGDREHGPRPAVRAPGGGGPDGWALQEASSLHPPRPAAEVAPSETAPSTPAAAANAPANLRCRKCRRLLAVESHAVPHERGCGPEAFDFRRRGGPSAEVPVCTSLFLEAGAVPWLSEAAAAGDVQGDLVSLLGWSCLISSRRGGFGVGFRSLNFITKPPGLP